jgi:hypothetical protein
MLRSQGSEIIQKIIPSVILPPGLIQSQACSSYLAVTSTVKMVNQAEVWVSASSLRFLLLATKSDA